MNIVILDAYTSNPGDLSWERFEKLGNFTAYDYTAPHQTAERMKDAEIVITNKTVISKEIIESSPKLRYIGVLATGYNVIDVEAAKKRNIPVCNVPTYSTNAVAQLTFALITEIYNRVAVHNDAVHNMEWTNGRDFSLCKTPLVCLEGKTIGIIGFGKIGNAVARIADAYEMNILCYVPSKKPMPAFKNFKFVSLDELVRNSDIISLHCPLTPETTGMVNRDFISKMKKNAVFINTARGASVDEQALADALNSGRIYGAGVDVLSSEPPKKDNPLVNCGKCIITPHIAWAGYET
ncbi:MAG: D-2-hydroxyacid dehydrogenase, partial [Clostridia bacterium]|nr:D-2-hydroxyacid dehydrogenase [Clostridia bacterium]